MVTVAFAPVQVVSPVVTVSPGHTTTAIGPYGQTTTYTSAPAPAPVTATTTYGPFGAQVYISTLLISFVDFLFDCDISMGVDDIHGLALCAADGDGYSYVLRPVWPRADDHSGASDSGSPPDFNLIVDCERYCVSG